MRVNWPGSGWWLVVVEKQCQQSIWSLVTSGNLGQAAGSSNKWGFQPDVLHPVCLPSPLGFGFPSHPAALPPKIHASVACSGNPALGLLTRCWAVAAVQTCDLNRGKGHGLASGTWLVFYLCFLFLSWWVGEVIDPSAPAEGVGHIVAALFVCAQGPGDLGTVLTDAGTLEQEGEEKENYCKMYCFRTV